MKKNLIDVLRKNKIFYDKLKHKVTDSNVCDLIALYKEREKTIEQLYLIQEEIKKLEKGQKRIVHALLK